MNPVLRLFRFSLSSLFILFSTSFLCAQSLESIWRTTLDIPTNASTVKPLIFINEESTLSIGVQSFFVEGDFKLSTVDAAGEIISEFAFREDTLGDIHNFLIDLHEKDGYRYGVANTRFFFRNDFDGVKTIIFKLSPAGDLMWEREYSPEGRFSSAQSLHLDDVGNLIIFGSTSSQQDGLDPRAFLAKFTPEGEIIWERHFDSSQNMSCVLSDTSVQVVLLKNRTTFQFFNLSQQEGIKIDSAIIQYDGGGFRPIARIDSKREAIYLHKFTRGYDVTKFSFNGDSLWRYTKEHDEPTSTAADRILDLALGEDGSLFLFGGAAKTDALYGTLVTKISADGMLNWERHFTAPLSNPISFESVKVENGRFYIAATKPVNEETLDALLTILDVEGQVLLDTVFSSPPGVLNYNENITAFNNTVFLGGNVIGDGPDKYVLNTYQFTPTSTWNPQQARVSIYPNPFQDQLKISTPRRNGRGILAISDMLGRIVWQEEILISNNENSFRLQLTPGVYAYRLTQGNRLLTSGTLMRE